MRKNFVWNMIGTSFNAFNSLFFFIIVIRINGMKDGGIFTIAFSLACLFCIIGVYAGRVFQVTDAKEELSDKEYIVNRITSCLLMMLVVFLYILFKGYNSYKTLIVILLSLLKCNEALSEVFFGIIQKNDCLHNVGKSLTFKSTASVLTLLIIDLITKNLVISFTIVNIVWFLSTILYDVPKAIKFMKKNNRLDISNVVKLYKIGFFTFAFTFLSIFLVNIQKYALDGRVLEGIQAIYGVIIMPGTVVSLCGQFLLNPFLNKLTNYFKDNNKVSFENTIKKVIYYVLLIGIIIMIATWLFGIQILSLVYNIGLDDYLVCLLIIMIGAILYTMSVVFSTALTTIRYTFIQFAIYLFTSITGFIVSILLIDYMGILGASIAYLLIMFIQFILYYISYKIIMKKF